MRYGRHHAAVHEAQFLVKNVNDLARIMHEAFQIARTGRPGPVVVDIPKDIQFATGPYIGPSNIQHKTYRPKLKPEQPAIREAVDLIAAAKKPVFYTGGGVINSGPKASQLLRELVRLHRLSDHVDVDGARRVSQRPTSNGSACSACTARTKPTWRCMTATS